MGTACGFGEAGGDLGGGAGVAGGSDAAGFGLGAGGGTAGFFFIIVPGGDMEPVSDPVCELRRSPKEDEEEAAELRRRSKELVGLSSSRAFFSTCLKKSLDLDERTTSSWLP